MKKFDDEEEIEEHVVPNTEGDEIPTAVYTVYNVNGDPIGHRLLSFQPVYENDDTDQDTKASSVEYELSDAEELPNMTVLKGGLFSDRSLNSPFDKTSNIKKLKHAYLQRYLDKRRKRLAGQGSTENVPETATKKDMNVELFAAENSVEITTVSPENQNKTKRVRRNALIDLGQPNEDLENTNELSVIPLNKNHIDNNDVIDQEMSVIPLQYNSTNSTEIDNLLDKRDKRTNRKSDRLNSTDSASKP